MVGLPVVATVNSTHLLAWDIHHHVASGSRRVDRRDDRLNVQSRHRPLWISEHDNGNLAAPYTNSTSKIEF